MGQCRIVERARIDTNRPDREERPKPKIDFVEFAWGVSFFNVLRRYQVTGYNWICKTATQPMAKRVVSQNRSEGLRRFKLAGRPTTDQFVLVYGERGR